MTFLFSLNGCVQGVAFLGPAFSYSQTGNIAQSVLSYGSNQVFKKMKDKSNTEKNKKAFDNIKTASDSYSFLMIQDKINHSSNMKNLANQ